MRRIRFSLSSLVLFTLLAASAASLALSYSAWNCVGLIAGAGYTVSPDARYVALIQGDAVLIQALPSGRVVFRESVPCRKINSVCFSRQSDVLLIGGEVPILFNWRTRTVLSSFPESRVSASPGETLVHIKRKADWHILYGLMEFSHPERRIEFSEPVIDWTLSPCGCHLLVSLESGSVLLVSWPDGRRVKEFFRPKSYDRIGDFSPDGSRFIIMNDEQIEVCDAFTGTVIAQAKRGAVSTISFLDSRRLYSTSTDDNLCIWNAGDCTVIGTAHCDSALQGAQALRGGALVVTFEKLNDGASKDEYSSSTLWNSATLEKVRKMNACTIRESSDRVLLVAWDGTVWDLDHDAPIYRLSHPIYRLSSPILGVSEILQIPRCAEVFCARKATSDGSIDQPFLLARTRPEPWWGLAWLPEFWTTLFLAAAFFWNLFRKPKPARVAPAA
jgi:WD40 repeat protein